jgi:hypothetical protein
MYLFLKTNNDNIGFENQKMSYVTIFVIIQIFDFVIQL